MEDRQMISRGRLSRLQEIIPEIMQNITGLDSSKHSRRIVKLLELAEETKEESSESFLLEDLVMAKAGGEPSVMSDTIICHSHRPEKRKSRHDTVVIYLDALLKSEFINRTPYDKWLEAMSGERIWKAWRLCVWVMENEDKKRGEFARFGDEVYLDFHVRVAVLGLWNGY